MRRSRGFTLVELMVVVAILGLLVTLAAVEYQRMVSQSRRTEAVANLHKIHELQTAYHTEHGSFGTFREIGFWVEGRARYDYCYGTGITQCVYASTTGVSGAVTASNATGGGGPLLAVTLLPIFIPPSGPAPFLGGNPHVATTSYEVVARGRISPWVAFDAWAIDNRNDLRNTIKGY